MKFLEAARSGRMFRRSSSNNCWSAVNKWGILVSGYDGSHESHINITDLEADDWELRGGELITMYRRPAKDSNGGWHTDLTWFEDRVSFMKAYPGYAS